MTLSDLAALGSFVSGLGVLVTVIFLVIQVRQNNAALRRAEATATQASASVFRMAIVANRDVAQLLTVGLEENGALDAVDGLRFASLVSEIVWFSQHIWHRQQLGLFPKGEWERGTAVVTDLLMSARGGEWWQGNKSAFSPDFIADMDKALQARNKAA